MDKSKLIPVIFLVIILGVGFVAYKFYSDNQILTNENELLKKKSGDLAQENKSLISKNKEIEREKRDLEIRWDKIESELSRLEKESETWQKKYREILSERDDIMGELTSLKTRPRIEAIERTIDREETREAVPSQDYWVDFVKTKAAIEAELEAIKRELLNAKNEIARVESENKEYSIRLDELFREKERLDRDIEFKNRTIDIISRDMVKEREDRKKRVRELEELQRDNADLKRELVMTGKEKLQLQNTVKDATEKKQALERKVSEIENLLKEKTLVFEELKDQLNRAIYTEEVEETVVKKAEAVELPPIVVKPGAQMLEGFRGEIIAVNQAERFVVLDLGQASGIRPGVQLKIMRGDKNIGTVEVIETRKEISAADIKESTTVVREGDIVVSK
jgi:chromosome segregation ATPase